MTAKLAADVRKGFKELLQYPHMSRDGYLALHTLFSFRARSIGDALQGFVEEAEEYGVELWAAIFPPSISWMVGQNYSILKEYLKDIQVMLYHRGDGAEYLHDRFQKRIPLRCGTRPGAGGFAEHGPGLGIPRDLPAGD